MKRKAKTSFAAYALGAAAAICSAFLISCESGVGGVPNTGSGGTTDPGTDGSSFGVYVLDYSLPADFDVQAWVISGTSTTTCDLSAGTDGGIRITAANSAGWAGGSLAYSASNAINLTNVAKITFKIRGNAVPGNVIVDIQPGAASPAELKVNLSGSGLSALSATEWTPVTVSVPATYRIAGIKSAFAFILDPAAKAITNGVWIELKDIDWVDSSDKTIDIVP